MKKKLFLLLCTMLTMIGVQAQTDVTSTYLTNADFSSSTPINSNLKGYGKDGSPYGFQTVDGWTSVVTKGASDGGYANSGMAAAVFAYGSSYQLQGNNKTAPATNPDSEATGNCFGFFAVWECGGYYYQNVTLPAGRYTITVPMYSQSGTQANTTYTGFFPTSGTNRTIAVNPTVGQWANQSVTFTLTQETAGQIRIGYKSTGGGSGANPHIFIDCVKIEYTDPNLAAARVKLGGYIQKATALNGVFDDSDLETAISEAQDVLDDAITATACNTASSNLSAAITTALSGKTPVSLTNGDFNTTPNNTLNGNETNFGGTLSTSTSNPDNTKEMSANTGDHAYLYDVTGWTQYSKFNQTAAQGTTSEYGTAMPANGRSTNSTTPPASDMFGETAGAALHLSAGWSDQARYQQTIANLPSGRYVLYYEVINKHSNTGIASNYIGVNGTSGDFYGTTNSSIYSGLKTIEQDVWKAQAFEFDVAKTANINFSVGVTTSTSGSGNGAKLWIDNILVYRIADIIVTEEDANAIIESAEALDDVKFNATDKADLAKKLSDFKAAKNIDNYNALNAAIIQANASKDVYTTLNAAITNVEAWTATTAAEGIRSKYNSGTYSNETTAENIYAEYQAAEISALAADGSAVDWTSVILNASFETGDMTGWSAESRNDTGVKDQSNGTYSITSGDPVDGSKLFNSWGGTAENDVKQTIKGLPAGTYTLTALLAGFKGESLVLAAGATTKNVVVAGDKTVGYTVDVMFTLAEAGDVEIKASNTKDSENKESDASFIKADNFKLYKGDVMTDNYAALNAAIEAAEANTLGFDKDEYAPYNNVAALSALANAKAVNQEKETAQPLLDDIVSALTGATWTANATDVDAVFNGSFSSDVEGDWGLTGWTRTNAWGQQRNDLPANSGANTNYGYYNQSGSLQYGNAGVYTMPLKANTIYSLTFKYASFDNNNNNKGMTVSVLNGEEGMAAMNFDANSTLYNVADGFVTKTLVFATGTAGNYVLTLANSGNTVMTDVSITKAASQVLTFSDAAAMPSYAPGTYPSVSISRTIASGKWSTLVVPVSMDIPGNLSVKEMDSFDENTLSFKNAENIVAGTPYMVKPTGDAISTIEATNVAVAALSDVHNITKGDLTMKGVYESGTVDVSEGNTNRYIVSGNQLHKVTGNAVKINPFRAYFELVGSSSARDIIMNLDEATIINALEASEAEGLKDGKYLVKGKIVLVKNGVKFNANGQILK